jgi:MFS family permease
MRHHGRISLHSNILYTIMVIGFVYALHLALPVYIASSFLEQFTSATNVGYVYMAGSVATIVGFLLINSILARFGNKVTTIWLIILQIFLSYGIITTESFPMLASYFILQTAVIAMIGFNLDVFIEAYSDIQHVGGIRGMYLTIVNSAWIIAPLLGSAIVDGDQYRRVYMAAFGLLFVLFYLVQKNFNKFHDPKYPHITVWKTVRHILKTADLTKVFVANIILQTFYAWMVIYSPIYLHTTIGLSWQEIGIVFTIMLLPFVIFQLPAGKLADSKWGEKELMTIGFIIMGVATFAISYIHSTNILVWAGILFITRVGASIAEIMIETYFFKKVNPSESNVLSIFRITRQLAYFVAPAITVVGLVFFTDYSSLFSILAVVVLLATCFTLTIKDTK